MAKRKSPANKQIRFSVDDVELARIRKMRKRCLQLQKAFGTWFDSSDTTSEELRDLAWLLDKIYESSATNPNLLAIKEKPDV